MQTELRRHPAGEIPNITAEQMEITLTVRPGNNTIVERRGNGRFQATRARPGTLWLCPIGVTEDSIRMTEALPEVFHLYLPATQFDALSTISSRKLSSASMPYLADVDDNFIRAIGYRMMHELQHETAGGKLLAESLSIALLVHLVSTHGGYAEILSRSAGSAGALDSRRLRRVLDYIATNLTRDLSITELAEVACLSRYHFARSFRIATGLSPYRYVSQQRLNYAKEMLLATDCALTEITLDCGFSSQSSFTRAFQRSMGVSPGAYRRFGKS